MLKQKTSGFQVFNYWLGLHYLRKGGSVPESLKLNTQAKLKFNSLVRTIKDQYGFTSEEIKGLILYCYTHNPLHLPDTLNYGSLANIRNAAPDFAYWLKHNRDLVNLNGLNKAIEVSVQKVTETDKLLYSMMADFEETFE